MIGNKCFFRLSIEIRYNKKVNILLDWENKKYLLKSSCRWHKNSQPQSKRGCKLCSLHSKRICRQNRKSMEQRCHNRKNNLFAGEWKDPARSKNITGIQMDPRRGKRLRHSWSRKGLRRRTVFSERGLSVYGE